MKKFKLGETVVVSDPCYKLGTWCQGVLNDVLPGEYIANIIKAKDQGWGRRVAEFVATHVNHKSDDLYYQNTPFTIGVDSGQAGIFDINHYRNDDDSDSYDIEPAFDDEYPKNDGNKWYSKICSLTINEPDSWGVIEHGVVSTSGYGDGSYDLYIAKKDDKVVSFKIKFINDEYFDD